MTRRDQSVKTYSGTPPTTAFGGSQGTPIVIDYAAAIGYFMHPTTGVVTALGGGGGGGTVTSVSASGTIVTGTVTNATTTPNIALALANTTVVAGSYTSTNLTVDAQGRITAASNGSGGSTFAYTSKSANYTFVIGDANQGFLHPASDANARTFTIPANASVAYAVGTYLVFVNGNNGQNLSIAITTDTMRLAGNGTTGTRTMAPNSVCVASKIDTTEWIFSGTGAT